MRRCIFFFFYIVSSTDLSVFVCVNFNQFHESSGVFKDYEKVREGNNIRGSSICYMRNVFILMVNV